MKRVSAWQIAVAFVGSFLGAGFVSGQELLQFFGVFGGYGIIGMILTIVSFGIFGYLSMIVAKRKKLTDFDKVIVRKEGSKLRTIFGVIVVFYLFGVMVIMIAGAGTLVQDLFGIPAWLANSVMTVFVILVAIFGAQGLLASFELLVPLLAAAALIISIVIFAKNGGGSIAFTAFSGTNPLLGNWFFAVISYVSYNLMAAISILVPLSAQTKDETVIRKGMVIGTLVLTVIFAGVLLPITFHKQMIEMSEMPMLDFARMVGAVMGMVYTILLLGGMFGGALSSLYAITVRVKNIGGLKGTPLMIVISVLAFFGSMFGFKQLVGTVFPVFGYLGFFSLPCIFEHYLFLKRKPERNTSKRADGSSNL